uniref:(northern house mosquito) hypothetical protein n=1 Tax=Culex pipiens TaxID=7175 RepID=A0A8D8ADU1_CULPI
MKAKLAPIPLQPVRTFHFVLLLKFVFTLLVQFLRYNCQNTNTHTNNKNKHRKIKWCTIRSQYHARRSDQFCSVTVSSDSCDILLPLLPKQRGFPSEPPSLPP